jgi:hypothetical protein
MTIVVGIPGVQGPPGTGINPRGTWSADATYAINDAATFAGSAYTALQPNIGAQPNLTPLQWSLFVEAGAAIPMTGSNGTQGGTAGSVPAPAADAQGRFLRGDGTLTTSGPVMNQGTASGSWFLQSNPTGQTY